MSSDTKSCEFNWHFDMCPDLSSSDSNPTDSNPMTNERNEYYPKYRIAGGRIKFNESDTGTEHHYAQFPGIELDEIGEWHLDYNKIAPCEWTMCNKEYAEWYLSTHPKPVDMREATRHWLNRRTHCTEGSIQLPDLTRNTDRIR